MVPPSNLLNLAGTAEGAAADSAEVIEQAAEIVEGFTANSTSQALDALLATTELDSLGEAAQAARGVAQQSLYRSQVLSNELTRFLSTTDKS